VYREEEDPGTPEEPVEISPADLLQISTDAREIADLTDDLTHIDAEGALPVAPLDVAEFLEAFVEELPEQFPHPEFGEVEWDIDLLPTPLKAEAASTALPQVLEPLLLLACRECKKDGTVKLTSAPFYLDHAYTGTEVIPAGEYIVISVHDGGEGVPEEELDHFFEGRDRKYGDIDLTGAESMVRHMGGVMDVDTLPGYGTTCSIYLPVYREEEDPGTPEEPAATVLVVEDRRDQVRWLKAVLHGEGCRVLSADSADGAVEALNTGAVDVVLLDLVLANDTGPRDFLFRRLQAEYPEVPIVVTCGEVDSHVLAGVIQAGAAGYVEKPFQKERLTRLIKREALLSKSGEA